MFNIFRKKSQVENLISTDGIEHATDRFSEIIAQRLVNPEIAFQFILQELDGARGGNTASQLFAKNSGIYEVEYRGTLNNSVPEVDGHDGPQLLLLQLSMQISSRELMAKLRCMIADKIMQRYKFGKYAQKKDRIDNLLSALKIILLDDKDVMPALTPNIPVPANSHARHIDNRMRNIADARELLNLLTQMTGDESEIIIKHALLARKIDENETSLEFSLDEKKAEIGNAIVTALNQVGKKMLEEHLAIDVVNETLQQLSVSEILMCKTSVACLFAMCIMADSAFKDGEREKAKYISSRCKPIGRSIMQLPKGRYSNLEFTLIDSAFGIMQKIDG